MPVQRRHRSSIACQNCRRRKVRCSVTVTGIPCTNCTQDRSTCAIQESSHELPTNTDQDTTRQSHQIQASKNVTHGEDHAGWGISDAQASSFDHGIQSGVSHRPATIAYSSTREPSHDVHEHSDPERQRDLEEEQSGAELSYAARGQGDSNSGTPFYTGEEPGVTSLIDARESLPRHIMLKPNPPSALSPDDREFLQRKGALTPLRLNSHQQLLLAYFQHVHPLLPILHLEKLEEFEFPSGIPLNGMLLYWSMAVVAVNFIPSNVWKMEGFTSRKHMKDTLYNRAKCMYDNSGETDKEVMLQSALLLSFWHSEKDSHSQPWYWSGIAINWCQIIGLHRDPDAARVNPLLSPQRRKLWRRLWASCLFRDRWLSLTLGRPLRIRLSDCDMPLPTAEDVLSDLVMLTDLLQKYYISPDLEFETQNWISLIQLSTILGDVLTLCYQQLEMKPTLAQFDALEDRLSALKIPSLGDCAPSSRATFSNCHLQLHLQATLITFYRPFVSTIPRGLPSASEKPWKARMRSHMETAATQVNTILDCIAREDLVSFASPATPPLLVPAMHVHLLGCKSDDRLTRRLAFNKLEMCMTIMRELQKTHTSASIFCGVFGEAVRQLMPGPLDETVWGTAQIRGSSTTYPVMGGVQDIGFGDTSLQPVVTDDILESLLNETSTYNFWESMNLPEQSVMEYGRY